MILQPPCSSRLTLSTLFFFFFNDTATTEIYTLSLHDALPIYSFLNLKVESVVEERPAVAARVGRIEVPEPRLKMPATTQSSRSEEHTSELQSLRHLVCRLLLEKEKAHV